MKKSILVALAVIACPIASAGLGAHNVLVVVNGDSLDSLEVANLYVKLRHIPDKNVVVIHGLGKSASEFIAVDHFRSKVLGTVFSEIKTRGLAGQIDCVAYSVDMPYSVNLNSDVKGIKLPQILTTEGSANGLTYLHEWVEKKDLNYLQLDVNKYARRLLPLPTGKPLNKNEQALYAEAVSQYDRKDYNAAIAGLKRLLQVPRSDPNIAYNLACSQALAGYKEDALASLRLAVGAGWRNYGQTSSDPDLNSLKSSEEFQRILRLIKNAHIEVQAGTHFQASTKWSSIGESSDEGPSYMLSTFLGVHAGRGNSVDEILDSLKKASSADFSRPKGTFYFEKNGDVRSRTREWGFQPAAEALKSLGFNAVVEDGILPKNKLDVAGGVIGIADFNWPSSGSKILPGAIVEHLTSCGGMISKGAPQTPCTEFIKNGAAGSSGAVTEPYALQEKFPTPFIHVQYAKGFTLAESFYMSLSGPYQLLVIGDPMCHPWAQRASVKLGSLVDGAVISKPVSVTPTLVGPVKAKEFRLYIDGVLKSTFKPGTAISFSSAVVGEGWHTVAVAAVSADSTGATYETQLAVLIPGTTPFSSVSASTSSGVNRDVSVSVVAKGASEIQLVHFGEVLGTVSGSSGKVLIEANKLGVGESIIYPIAIFKSGSSTKQIRLKPIRVQIGN